MTAAFSILLWIVITGAVLLCFLGAPLLFGFGLRAVGRSVNPNLLSLLGASVVVVLLSLVPGIAMFERLLAALLPLREHAPVFLVVAFCLTLLSAMAVPFLLVRLGIGFHDRRH